MTVPQSCKTILFDLDGTLLEVHERFFLAFNRTLGSLGNQTLGWDQFLADFRSDALTRFMPEGDDPRRHFLRRFLRYFNEAGNEIAIQGIPGVHEALEILRSRGYSMGVVTGRRTQPESVQKELDQTGFLRFFDHVFSHADGYADNGAEAMEILSKKTILLHAADQMGVPVESCMFVGDWTGDVQSARQAGVGFIVAVLSGGLDEHVLKKEDPHLILPSVADLPAHLP